MNRNRATITGVAALLVVATVIAAAAALVTPADTQAAAAEVPVRIHDADDAFEVRWSVPEGVAVSNQLVTAWTDDGYGRSNIEYASPADDARRATVRLGRDHDAGTAFGFRVSMDQDGTAVRSKDHYRYPLGAMAKRPPSGLTAYWHHDVMRLDWKPGRNPNYVSQIAKCRTQEQASDWETVELGRVARKVIFRDLDPNQCYVCRVEARKANGHYQMTNAANADRKRIATPGSVTLQQTERGAETVRFGWSLDDTAGISKLLIQREGPLPNDFSRVYPGWRTIAELEPDAASHVDTIAVESDVVFYNYRVIAVGERGGSTVGRYGVCRLERDGDVEHYDCGRANIW